MNSGSERALRDKFDGSKKISRLHIIMRIIRRSLG